MVYKKNPIMITLRTGTERGKIAPGGASRQVGYLTMTSLRHISGSLLMGSTAQLYLIRCGLGINIKNTRKFEERKRTAPP